MDEILAKSGRGISGGTGKKPDETRGAASSDGPLDTEVLRKIDRLPQLGSRGAYAKQAIRNALIEHRRYINARGEDHPVVLGWRWGERGPVAKRSSTEADNV